MFGKHAGTSIKQFHNVFHRFFNDYSIVFSVKYFRWWWTEGPFGRDLRITGLHGQNAEVEYEQLRASSVYCPIAGESRHNTSPS